MTGGEPVRTTGAGRYHPALDGLRAVAVIAVVLYHAGATTDSVDLAPGGFLGVSVFFTLSGYLVTTVLLRDLRADGRIDIGRFWVRRVRRLVPASLMVVIVVALLAPAFWSGFRVSDALAAVFGSTNWYVIVSGEDALLRTIVGPLGPYWSLAVEEQFYVLLSLTFLVAARTSTPLRLLRWAVGLGWVGSLAAQVAISDPQFRVEFGTDTRGSELLAGCALALVLHERPAVLDRLRRVLPAVGIVAMAAVVGLVGTTDYEPPWLLEGGFAALSVLNAALVASLLRPGLLTFVLAWRPAVVVGRMSYSWYVIHWPVILILTADRTGVDGWALVALKIAASSAAAAALHLLVEQRFRYGRVSGQETPTAVA